MLKSKYKVKWRTGVYIKLGRGAIRPSAPVSDATGYDILYLHTVSLTATRYELVA